MAAGVPAARPAGPQRSKYFLLENYYLRNSTQKPRLDEYMSQGLLPALAKVHSGPKLFLDAVVAAHMPQYATLLGFESLEEVTGLDAALHRDESWKKAFLAWEKGPEAPYEFSSRTLLHATDYCPVIEPAAKRGKPRLFELRVYHSPTWTQLAALHQRFAGAEIKIFHRSGVYPILYSDTVVGANMPNLTYLTPFDSLAAREKAWDAFSSDPEWIRVRKESVEQHGQVSSVIQITLFRAASYSPIG
jgi:hypothetical protein